MTICLLNNSYKKSCQADRTPGGLHRRMWLFNIKTSAGVVAATETDNVISALTLPAYSGLYKVDSMKFAHSAGDNIVNNAGGGKFFTHTVTIRMIEEAGSDLEMIQDLLGADVGAIVETMAHKESPARFRVYGLTNGLTATEGEQNFGQENEANVARTITLTGAESDAPKFFFVTDYSTTLTALEGYEL